MLISARARAVLGLALASGTLSGAAAAVPALVVALIAAVLFDRYDPGLTVMQLVFVAIASVMLRLALAVVARVAAGSAALLASRDLRAAAATTIGALPLGDLADRGPGAFEAVLLDDVDRATAFIAERMPELASAFGLLVTAFLVLLARDPGVAVAGYVLTVAAMAVAGIAGPRARDRAAEREARAELGAAVFEAARGTELDRSLPDAGLATRALPALARAYRLASERSAFGAVTRAGLRRAIAGSFAAALVLGALATGAAHAEPALLVLIAALGLRTIGAWVTLFESGADGAPARAAWSRVRDLLRRPAVTSGAGAFPVGTDVRFRGVRFAYPASDASVRGDVLHDVDFTAADGKTTAIVGPSGSGKTTITRLAARFWDVDAGAVEIGGVDVRTVPLDALMRHVAFVFQDVALLDDTVAVNLRLGRPDATDAELIVAAKAAGAHAFIETLPGGYATLIGERGAFLSRGERQRLQIARAILKDAPILILDEPTASMDPATEADIADAVEPLWRGKTVIVVAHRLATIAGADRIVVLDGSGHIEAQGTHAELVRASATYAAMWAAYRPEGIAP